MLVSELLVLDAVAPTTLAGRAFKARQLGVETSAIG
jgi:hypothetical protein